MVSNVFLPVFRELYFGHYGMQEIYVHFFAGILLFLTSIFSILLIRRTLKHTAFRLPGLLFGNFFVGLIGFGEVVEHFFREPFIVGFLHYLHLISGLGAMVFYYYGIKEFAQILAYGESDFFSEEIQIGVTATTLTIPFIFSAVASTPVASVIEMIFILILFIPFIILSYFLIKELLNIRKSMLVLYPLAMGVMLIILNFAILIGRIGDVADMPWLYIIAHSFQDILLAGFAAVLLLFSFAFVHAEHINALYVEPEKMPKKPRSPRPRREIY